MGGKKNIKKKRKKEKTKKYIEMFGSFTEPFIWSYKTCKAPDIIRYVNIVQFWLHS